jgi:outer membrane protein assembly factor BamB
MDAPDFVYVGFKNRVAALHRLTGELIWQWKAAKGCSYVTLLLDREVLIVSVDGYMYGLEACSGIELWFNNMTGFGTGVASIASVHGSSQNQIANAAAISAAAAVATSTTHVSS